MNKLVVFHKNLLYLFNVYLMKMNYQKINSSGVSLIYTLAIYL